MEPVSLIVAALAAGAVAGTQSTATEAVSDAYTGLKALVRRRLHGRPAGEIALEQHAVKPEQWDKALEAELIEVDAGSDAPTVEAAQRLMALLDAPGTRSGRYVVEARDSVFQVGNYNTMKNTFRR